MNEEEEQAIERLKKIEVNTYSEGKARAIDTVLNLIEKLQKENEELKLNNEKYIIHLTDEQYKTAIENAQNDINQKWIQKVKDKISERQFELQQEYKDFEDDAILTVLQELIEMKC